jgi:hypothetical protein
MGPVDRVILVTRGEHVLEQLADAVDQVAGD